MWCNRCGKNILQIQEVIILTGPAPQVILLIAEQVSFMGFLKTFPWGALLDMLLGLMLIVCFLIGLVFAFWV